jgi:hypothetical protein
LEIIKGNLNSYLLEIKSLGKAVIDGNDLYKPQVIGEVELWKTKLELEKLSPDNIQKNHLPKLIAALENTHRYYLSQHLEYIGLFFTQTIRLIIGEAGTGKTHGLANCVESHLNQGSPAIIIQAKGSPLKDWTEILSKALELNNWTKDEILSALETLAIKTDVQKSFSLKPGEETKCEYTKVLICIDGLEEDIENQKEWYSRIRECELFALAYPRVRFIFSARRYFYDNTEVPKRGFFEEVSLPREGDVPILEIAKKYFSKEHYNIELSSYSLIKGIDSLFALRLFCEQYKNTSLKESDKIITAIRDLLNSKIEKINHEFLASLQNRKGKTRNPVLDSLEIIADHFYSNLNVEHDHLIKLISPAVKDYLSGSEMDLLIDYLSNNAFLIKSERIEISGMLKKKIYYYYVTYQSIIEHIISEKIYHEIRKGTLNQIPQILHQGMIQPLEFTSPEDFNPIEKFPNQKIIQNIVDGLFIETGQLIGEDNFLIDGFSTEEIFEMQMEALRKAPTAIANKYKKKVDEMFYGGYGKQFLVLKYLILPSSHSNTKLFGAEYLHKILMNQPSAFERDKLWSGLDSYETKPFDEEESLNYNVENNISVFYEFGIERLSLSEFHLHDELPLVYAWGLSTIDQQLRNNLRIAITEWAIKNPSEFLLLLNKIFTCNDPQIQEDLASIMLGVASKLKDKEKIKDLALWSILKIFSNLETHRNVIVRQGFRAIVEKAFQFDVIAKTEVEKCRPIPMETIILLPLEKDITIHNRECYPIVHDLAWYVIENAYNDFLEFPSSLGDDVKDNDCIEAQTLLNKFRDTYDDKNLFASKWGMSAAIAYIRSLGLTRTEGNWCTEASHGSKSKIFTYEEKYTWLAVHYIQGYLSDYIPLKGWSNEREFVKDYSQLTDIPNPAESIIDIDDVIGKFKTKNEWIVKEVLSKEIDTKIDFNEGITNWVNEEPNLNFDKWLSFDSSDFQLEESNRKWIALYNHTSLHDSKELGYSYFEANACLIEKRNFDTLIEIIQRNPDELHFISHFDGLHSSPQTDTYCNPSDIVWMSWIGEDAALSIFYDDTGEEKELYHSLTRIVKNTIEGESYIMLPSKKIRELIGCYELSGNELKDANQNTIAFNYKVSEGSFRDHQELVVVEVEGMNEAIRKEGFEIIWFVELFKEKNPLNKTLDKNFHIQKTRKYFVWSDNIEMKHLKFWDETFSNQRDRDED